MSPPQRDLNTFGPSENTMISNDTQRFVVDKSPSQDYRYHSNKNDQYGVGGALDNSASQRQRDNSQN